jgi:hypothetical protein
MSVAALKEAIGKQMGLPGARLRLRTGGAQFGFAMKDNHNLAFFNIPDQATLQVVLKK